MVTPLTRTPPYYQTDHAMMQIEKFYYQQNTQFFAKMAANIDRKKFRDTMSYCLKRQADN